MSLSQRLFENLKPEFQTKEIWNMNSPLRRWSFYRYHMTYDPIYNAKLIRSAFFKRVPPTYYDRNFHIQSLLGWLGITELYFCENAELKDIVYYNGRHPNNDGYASITYNYDMTLNMKFEIACQIGLILMYPEYLSDSKYNQRKIWDFATELLMPAQLVLNDFRNHTTFESELAIQYGVPIGVMYYRTHTLQKKYVKITEMKSTAKLSWYIRVLNFIKSVIQFN